LLFDNKHPLSVACDLGVESARVAAGTDVELRHLRTFLAVAECQSFTQAAEDLHIVQQAVSQQIKSLERVLGVTLLRRTPRRVELTPEGSIFLSDCRRVVAAADRAVRRVEAAARGEVGTLRLAYTLTTVWETLPRLVERLNDRLPDIRIEAREVFGGDIPELLSTERCDLALAPRTSNPRGFHSRALRREPLCVALNSSDKLAGRKRLRLGTLRDRLFELWPRDMAPGFYDTVVATCRIAGFEPRLDEQAAGNTVWGNIARGRGVALINASIAEQLPARITLIELEEPKAPLTYDVVWYRGELPLIKRSLDIAAQLTKDESWL
jgi:DNA-binding transcriptional LysR family regulator